MTNLSVAKRADEAAAALPHALPAWVYNHGELTRLELERILKPSWQIVCHLNSIPKAGDYETLDLGPESVLVLRDRDGTIRGFHNVCRHRGARLLDGSGNCPATITCPYHGWTYRHDGGLIGMPVRDLTFRVHGLPARGSKENATHFEEICGGNALNGAIGIVRLGGRASICGPMGDSRETSSRYIFEQMAHEGIETKHIVHMPGLVTPISAIMIDPSGERTIVTFRDPQLWKVQLPAADKLLEVIDDG